MAMCIEAKAFLGSARRVCGGARRSAVALWPVLLKGPFDLGIARADQIAALAVVRRADRTTRTTQIETQASRAHGFA